MTGNPPPVMPRAVQAARDVQSARSFVAFAARGAPADPLLAWPRDGRSTWSAGSLKASWFPRRGIAAASPRDLPTIVLGDHSECAVEGTQRNLAGGVPIYYSRDRGAVVIHTSIVGLPPVFVYRGAHVTAVASDIYLLAEIPGVTLELDPQGVEELGRIGHPVGQRTLFRNVTLAASASTLTLDQAGEVQERTSWTLPEAEPLSWPDFIDAQISTFVDSMRRMDLSDAFLSLTAGLDTRTVFAALAADGRKVPAATMRAVTRSLDARAASALCKAYGVPFHDVVFDERFARDLPEYVETASRLSGGLAGLEQAPEVYFYRQLDGRFGSRLSGNLGNQVGRGGTEGVSTRGAVVSVLSRELQGRQPAARGHWLLDELHTSPRTRMEFILTREIPFTLVSNYPIGNHFARQQTPYASRQLIETLSRRPASGSGPSRSKLRMRLRDLSHRFLGEPAEVSFQRTLLRRIGGFAAQYPINWGWRARGGVSVPGLVLGAATLAGIIARSRDLDRGVLRHLPALHDFRESRRWLRDSLKDFTYDTVTARRTQDLFDQKALRPLLEEHFSGRRDHYTTVTFALDVALAETTLRPQT